MMTLRQLKARIDEIAENNPKALDYRAAVDTEARCDQAHFYEIRGAGVEDDYAGEPLFYITLSI